MDGQKIIVTGSKGQLVSELKQLASLYSNYQFVFLSKEEAPLDNYKLIQKIIDSEKPSYLINCAAYTAVDKAELEIEQSDTINGIAVGQLAAICKSAGTHFLHISTDYVFNGKSNRPLNESDKVDPLNQYGKSKLLGEQLAFKYNEDTIVIRTSWVYSVYGKNFVHTMMRLMHERKEINVVNDQIGSPTNAADLALAIMTIIQSGKWIPGIYNFSNEGKISWYDFAVAIKNLTGSQCIINPISTSGFPTPAKRPAFSLLNKEKIVSTYKIKITDWYASLQKCINQINSKSNP
jgi:dTDP-4-dehydrorhamnose reductase